MVAIQIRSRVSKVAVLFLPCLLLSVGVARPDSDGYFCTAPGYLAYQFNGITVPGSEHVLTIVSLDDGFSRPSQVSLERFQVHGMKCNADSVELLTWDGIHTVHLSDSRLPTDGGKSPRPQGKLARDFLEARNLSDWSYAGVLRLASSDPGHLYELVIERSESAHSVGVIHHGTTSEILRKTRGGEIVERIRVYEGVAEETID